MPRFVILAHDHPQLHWDLMLEQGDALRTWRLLQRPTLPAEIPCEAIADHRLEYLTYEGPVSRNRGTVQQEFAGTYQMHRESTEQLIVELTAPGLNAQLTITPPAGTGSAVFHSLVDDAPLRM